MLKKLVLAYLNKEGLVKNIKNAGLYFLGSIIQSVFSLIVQPIYSVHLSAEEFGILGYFDAIKQFFIPLFILSMTSAYLMHYFKQSESENKKMLFNITFYLLCFNTITIFIVYIFIYFYFKSLGVTIPLNPFAWYILIALLLDNIRSIVLINFRIRKKALSYFTFSVINTVLNVGIGLLFVVVFKWGAQGRMLAPIISSLILLPYSIYVLNKYTEVYINLKLFIKEVRLVLPLILAAYAYVPISNIDRMFLERLNNLSEFGLYNIGITIAGYVQLAYVALGLAFEPDIFQCIAHKNYGKLFKVFAVMFLPYGVAILIFMTFSGTIINLLTAGKYMGAQVYTNIAVLGVFFMGIFSFFDKVLIAMGKTKLNLFTNVVGGTFSIIILYYLVVNYSFMGAAYGRVIMSILMVFISGYFVFKHLDLKKRNI